MVQPACQHGSLGYLQIMLLVVSLASVFSSFALADGLRIESVDVAALVLWKTDKGNDMAAMFELDQIPEQIPVEDMTLNEMLKVTVNGVTGFVMMSHVTTNSVVEVEVQCDASIRTTAVAGVRGIGEGCKND